MSRRRVGAVMRHELILIARDPLPVMILLVFPLFLMAFLKPTFRLALVTSGYPHANGAEQVVPGEAVANGFYIVGMTSFAFFAEYGWATWDRLRSSQATPVEIIAGKALPRLALSVLQFLVVFLVATPWLDLRIRGPLIALFPLVVAFSTCLVLLGVMITALCRTLQQASALAFGGLVLFGAVGGALVPLSVLPPWAKAIGPVTPTYWVMRGFGRVILDGQGFGGVLLPIGALSAMSACFLAVSVARFRVTDQKVGYA